MPRNLYFDEAGYTGNNLLDADQPYFVYLGVESDPALEAFFDRLKEKYGYNSDETKGKNIATSGTGRQLVQELWKECNGKVRYVVHNKKYALACKMFEYVYEPVFADWNSVLYKMGFHLFVASLMYLTFTAKDESSEMLFSGFQKFIRDKKATPFLDLVEVPPGTDHLLHFFFKFCEVHRHEIASDVDFTEPHESWLLDLTNTSLYSLLGDFAGESADPLNVTCDASKPLISQIDLLEHFIGDERILFTDNFGVRARMNFNLAGSVSLSSSKDVKSLQIADVLVSSIAYNLNRGTVGEKRQFGELTNSAMVTHRSVIPSPMSIALDAEKMPIYGEVMRELASRKPKLEKIQKAKRIGTQILAIDAMRERTKLTR